MKNGISKEIQQEMSELARAFEDVPLDLLDNRYYPFHEAKGNPRGVDPVRQLRGRISLMPDASSCQLFSGYRGTGKTTELRRLAASLEQDKYNVLFVEGEKYINLSEPVEVADLLLSVAAGVAEQVDSKRSGKKLRESLFQRFKGFIETIEIVNGNVKVQVGPDWARFTADLSRDPTFKTRVQGLLRGRLTELFEHFKAFLNEAREELQGGDFSLSPVLIVDDLEKLRGSGPNQDLVQRSVEQVFSEFHWSLKIPGWHTVWAAPPYLELMNASIPTRFDAWAFLPMVRLWHDNPTRTVDQDGLDSMLAFIRKRGDIGRAIDSEDLLRRIIQVSSGHVRDVIKLIGQVIVDVNGRAIEMGNLLPATASEVERIIGDYKQAVQNSVHKDDYPWLSEVAEKRNPIVPDERFVQRAAKLLDTAVVMMYRNDHRWFDVHAAVRERIAKGP